MHNKPHTEEAKAKMSASHTGVPLHHKRRPSKLVDGDEHYRCGRCGDFFPKGDFYKNKRTILGITSECRKCHTRTSLSSRDKDNARESNRLFMRRARVKDPEKFRDRERNRPVIKDEKYFARKELNLAIARGDIKKPGKCQECGARARITGHHEDYSKPLNVEWLCYECHGKRHRLCG